MTFTNLHRAVLTAALLVISTAGPMAGSSGSSGQAQGSSSTAQQQSGGTDSYTEEHRKAGHC